MPDSDPPEGVDSEDVERVMRRVLQAEQNKLHMDLPRGVINEIEAIIEDEVQ